MKYEINSKEQFDLGLRELWEYRELLLMLALRDFKVRYAQTAIGILWAFIQPLTTLAIFVFIFGKAIKIETGNIPYPVFAIIGITAWNFFGTVMSQAGNSIIGAQAIISKIYFPRLIFPLSKTLVGSIDLGINLLFSFIIILIYDVNLTSNIIFLPLFMLLLFLFSSSIGILLSGFTIRFRDIQYVIPFLVQVGLYISPVAYPANIVSDKMLNLYYLNPMAGIIEGFRWAIIGGPINFYAVAISIIFTIFSLFLGLFYFQKAQNVVADIV